METRQQIVADLNRQVEEPRSLQAKQAEEQQQLAGSLVKDLRSEHDGRFASFDERFNRLESMISKYFSRGSALTHDQEPGSTHSTSISYSTGTSMSVGVLPIPAPRPPDPPDFPKFDGTQFREWVNRCEQFFYEDRTPPEMMARLASSHMEGKALQWHRDFIRDHYGIFPSWPEYFIAVSARFCEPEPLYESMVLKQSLDSVETYMGKFKYGDDSVLEDTTPSGASFQRVPATSSQDTNVTQQKELIHNTSHALNRSELISAITDAISVEDDAVNLGFDTDEEPVVAGKQLLVASNGLSTQVLAHFDGEVSTDTYDDVDDSLEGNSELSNCAESFSITLMYPQNSSTETDSSIQEKELKSHQELHQIETFPYPLMQVVNWNLEEFKTVDKKRTNKTLSLGYKQEDGHEQKEVMKLTSSPWDNRVWKPGGISTKHDKWKRLEKCYKHGRLMKSLYRLSSTWWGYGKVTGLTRESSIPDIQNQEMEGSVNADSMVEQVGFVSMLMHPFRFDHVDSSLGRKLMTSLIINGTDFYDNIEMSQNLSVIMKLDCANQMFGIMSHQKELWRTRKRKQKRSKSWRFKFKGKLEAHKLTGRTIVLVKQGVVKLSKVMFVALDEDNHMFLDERTGNDRVLLEKFGSIDSYCKACLLLELIYNESVRGKTNGKELVDAGQKMQARLVYDKGKNGQRNVEAGNKNGPERVLLELFEFQSSKKTGVLRTIVGFISAIATDTAHDEVINAAAWLRNITLLVVGLRQLAFPGMKFHLKHRWRSRLKTVVLLERCWLIPTFDGLHVIVIAATIMQSSLNSLRLLYGSFPRPPDLRESSYAVKDQDLQVVFVVKLTMGQFENSLVIIVSHEILHSPKPPDLSCCKADAGPLTNTEAKQPNFSSLRTRMF